MRSRLPLMLFLMLAALLPPLTGALAQSPYGVQPPLPTPAEPAAAAGDQSPPVAPAVEGRGIWIEMKTLPPNADGIRKVVRQLARCNFNFLLLEVTYEGATLYPGPYQDPRFKGIDPLAIAVDEAHKNKLELHAWFWALKQARWREGEARPGGPVLASHPEWTAINQSGVAVSPGSSYYWLCTSRPEARGFVVSSMEDVARRYAIDGLHLDYIRYDRTIVKGAPPPYCMCDYCRQEYQKAGGADPLRIAPYTDEFRAWLQWRENLVSSLVAEISTRVKAIRPHLVVSAAVYPDPAEARRYFGQNWTLWLRNRYIDFVTPMLYRDQTETFVRRVRRYLQEGVTATGVVLPGVGVNEIQNRIFSHDVLIEQVMAARQQGMLGNVLFSFSVMNPYLEQFLINKVYVKPARVPFRDEAEAMQRLSQQARAILQNPSAVLGAREANWLLARAGDLEAVLRYRTYPQQVQPAGDVPITVPARYQRLPQGTVPRMGAINVDGSLADPTWKNVPEVKLALGENGGWSDSRTWAKMGTDGTWLYVAFHCEDAALADTVARTRREPRHPWQQDHVAVFLDPGPSRSQYLILRLNPLGRQALEKVPDGRKRPAGVGTPESVPGVLHWDGRVRRGDRFWNAEFRIPISELMSLHPGQKRLGLNLTRAHTGGRNLHYDEWVTTYGSPYDPLRFATMDL